jgi:hypothetical protein
VGAQVYKRYQSCVSAVTDLFYGKAVKHKVKMLPNRYLFGVVLSHFNTPCSFTLFTQTVTVHVCLLKEQPYFILSHFLLMMVPETAPDTAAIINWHKIISLTRD